jgi:LasA protease
MRRNVSLLALLSFLLALALNACNAPTNAPRSTLVFKEEELLQTAEAILEATPSIAAESKTSTPPSQRLKSIWPTLVPTATGDSFEYQVQPGDTLASLAGRFGVETMEIQSTIGLLHDGYLEDDQKLIIPKNAGQLSSAQRLLPDSELVFSPTAMDFNVEAFVQEAGGYLIEYREVLKDEEKELTGAEVVQRVASELSVNPRLLLALLDYRSGWVYDHPLSVDRDLYPIGFRIADRRGLYEELKIAATQLNLAYYGWREGSFTELGFEGGAQIRLEPTLNAGSVALMHLFSLLSDPQSWEEDLYSPGGFPVEYFNLFGDSWLRSEQLGALIPFDLERPELELPFLPGEGWSLTGGPHNAWNAGTPLGALDFSPIRAEEPCAVSAAWVTASASGVIVRARDNAVALDLDGDGYEGSGWVIVYYHIAEQEMIPEGLTLAIDQRIGHPSCEGGTTSGTHVHLARKYNGEWISIDDSVPFVLSGWRAIPGERIYQGQLIKGDLVVTADPAGRAGSTIIR